jgi:2-polyprenyl-3-methyl-5-hydroxy-6-metoxy-1,4-benzoquinol methylase
MKQQSYMRRMGVIQVGLGEQWPCYQSSAHSIVDIGGGPVSPLLKLARLQHGVVVDPGHYPEWTRMRYAHCGIDVIRERAEDWLRNTEQLSFDEAWCMNVLQHTVDPEVIVKGMRRVARRVRIFEWINTPPSLGHPHTLLADSLNEWLEGTGTVESIAENGANGL